MNKEELIAKKVSAISLGCDKNKVDLENMLGRLQAYGFQIVEDPHEANIVLINTCAFIEPAKEEAIANILEMINLKNNKVIEKIVVTGCLPQRYMTDIKQSLPEVDKFLPIKENNGICQVLEELYGVKTSKINQKFQRVLTNSPSYAYLKIADGCNNVCAFCAIPRIRGRYISLPMDDLVAEAKNLASRGVKELILVAQDITRYGEDLYGKNCLIELCEKLCKIKEIKWIRLHYTYPEKVDKTLLDYITKSPKICNYIDIPLQHIDDEILKSMRRKIDEQGTKDLIDLIKDYPEITLRSTFIVGYPGERRKEFKKLVEFLKSSQIPLAGFFPYYREENTASYYMKGQNSNFTKQSRLKKIRKVQNQIAQDFAQSKINVTFKVLVDYFDENTGEFVGHPEFLSPMVDFDVRFVDNGNVEVSTFVDVKIYDFDGKSFKGEIV